MKGTVDLGTTFHSDKDLDIQSFVHFPIPKLKIHAVTDANWGPQDQSVPPPQVNINQLDLYIKRSISGYLTILHCPLHWSAKRQQITARSTAKAEIYATDECVKHILHLSNIVSDLGLTKQLISKFIPIFNDNTACVQWANNKPSRNIRHIQIRENATRESFQNKKVSVSHVGGKNTPADIFTKEQKDPSHFIKLSDIILSKPFSSFPSTNSDESLKT